MSVICPCCGYNLRREQAIVVGPFSYDPTLPAFCIDGEPVRCRPQVREMLGSVMQARGRTLSFDVLADRVGSDAAKSARLIDVALYEARRIFGATPYLCPIERVRGAGLRWTFSESKHEHRTA
ncbi:winged helix-turn-helix domain-containing protein [Sphingomonas beigongshangi]|uniref:winged helix-turn-helix domain-containing protein n=1 Tax=Sphingomonas beigongshangi TaxID=2782540 RepID=UPI00193B42BF|nr:winged helix-turn-helix domain-containing protein [Sphingomonas beigongshangi]